jgi:hypothetical protein
MTINSPVVHTNENNWLPKLNRAGNNNTTIVTFRNIMRSVGPISRKRHVQSSAADLEAAAENPLNPLLHERMPAVLNVCYSAYDNDRKLRRRCGAVRCENIDCQAFRWKLFSGTHLFKKHVLQSSLSRVMSSYSLATMLLTSFASRGSSPSGRVMRCCGQDDPNLWAS